MTDDILTRLRSYAYLDDAFYNPWVYGEAADEIERLRAEIQQLKHDSTIFINERSDAICENFDLREENAELRDEIERVRARVDLLSGYLRGALNVIEGFVACDTEDARVALEGEKKDD